MYIPPLACPAEQGAALVSLGIQDSCISLTAGAVGGTLSTTDENGNTWCLKDVGGCEGGWIGTSCEPGHDDLFLPVHRGPGPVTGPANYSLLAADGQGGPGWNTQAGASGPWPHTRYISNNEGVFTMDLTAPKTAIQAADTLTSE